MKTTTNTPTWVIFNKNGVVVHDGIKANTQAEAIRLYFCCGLSSVFNDAANFRGTQL